MSMTSMVFRPMVDWVKRTVLTIAALELAEDATAAAGRTVEPVAMEGVTYPAPALPAPIPAGAGTGSRSKRS